MDDVAKTVTAMEREALERWGKGDPSGFLQISAPDVTYFDPFLDSRIDGLDALTRYYEGIRGKIHIDRFELLNPIVTHVGDLAVLTFNYVSYGGSEDRFPWNCTEVYRRTDGAWCIIQTHWSFTKSQRQGG